MFFRRFSSFTKSDTRKLTRIITVTYYIKASPVRGALEGGTARIPIHLWWVTVTVVRQHGKTAVCN